VDPADHVGLVEQRRDLEVVRQVASQLRVGLTVSDAEHRGADLGEAPRELAHLGRIPG
jgi:hypothetical protein